MDAARDAQLDAEQRLDECRIKLGVAEQENANLRIALGSARRIGAAIGILMASQKITDEQAFAVLSQASQATNRKVRDLAEDVLRTGRLD